MPDYTRGKIYKIISGDKTYIGSTTQLTLARRLSEHHSGYKQWKKGNARFITVFELIETGQYEIILIELFSCQSKDELHARERFWIETTHCVNKVIPNRKMEEWYNDNKERLVEVNKIYRDTNKELIKKKRQDKRKI